MPDTTSARKAEPILLHGNAVLLGVVIHCPDSADGLEARVEPGNIVWESDSAPEGRRGGGSISVTVLDCPSCGRLHEIEASRW